MMCIHHGSWMKAALPLALSWGIFGLCAARGFSASPRIELQILEPAERRQAVRSFPVTVGMVFPDGEVNSAPGGRLVDDQGRAVPFEAEPTGWWSPEKDRIKWLLIHFKADTDRKYFLEVGQKPQTVSGEPLAREDGGRIRIATGPLQVALSRTEPQLFGEVLLNGKSMICQTPASLVLVADDAGAETVGQLADWQARLEEATPARATVYASGFFRYPSGQPIARLELRYQFFRGESFVRLYHTLTWMVQDVKIGARELSLGLRPDLGEGGKVHVGLSDYGAEVWTAAWRPTTRLVAYQDDANHFALELNGAPEKAGNRLGGWLSLEGAEGRTVSVSLRHAWQMFPKTLSLEEGELRIGLWPRPSGRMSFAFDAIMPAEFYHHPVWKNFWWSQDAGHYTHEYARRRLADGKIVDSDLFLHTAEGVARTHELTFAFLDGASERTPAELNSVTQHPVVLRQDPVAATRVPFMGFQLEPVDTAVQPDLERAIDLLGRMVIRRWAASHDYGLWRFGLVWWGNRQYLNSLYRWSDGVQYDQQLLPWMLFVRGGGREFYENGEILARFAMDACTNHYNTRGCPTGYMGTAGGGMSFPFLKFSPSNMKGQKIHFLSYYYHLTGYRRAKEVLDEVISGTKEATRGFSATPRGRVASGREIFNMNVFWVNAYEETFSPEVKELARECLELSIHREYDAEKNTFSLPPIYRFNGLILQDQLWHDERLKSIMLRYLDGHLLRFEKEGGIDDVEATIACDWAYRQTGDARYARLGWDLCRQLADVLPDMDTEGDVAPHYPIQGNQIYRHFLGPILFNAGLGRRMNYGLTDPYVLRDTFLSLDYERKTGGRGEVFVRARRDGDLSLRLLFHHAGAKPVSGTAFGPDGREIARFSSDQPLVDLMLPGLKKGEVCKLVLEGEATTMACLPNDADVVHHIPDGHVFLTATQCGQYYGGNRIYTRTAQDEITFAAAAPEWCGYTMRDATTGELLYRSHVTQQGPVRLKLGKDRLICLVGPGYPIWDRRGLTGVVPYYSSTAEGWFDPSASRKP